MNVQRLFGIVVSSVVAQPAHAQQAPTLYIVPEMTVNVKALSSEVVWPLRAISVFPDGRMVVVPKSASGLASFTAAGVSLGWKVKVGWKDDAEITYVERMGIAGNQTWVSDGLAKQVSLLDTAGRIVRTIPYPTWVYPHWPERHRYPLFGRMTVYGVYPNGDLLVRPQGAHTVFDTKGYDRSLAHLVRITPKGAIVREVAQFDEWRGRLELRDDNATTTMQPPFIAPMFWDTRGDGSRVVFATPAVSGNDSGSVHVIAISGTGDTLFSRNVPMPAVRIPARSRDSALKAVRGFGAQTADDVRKKVEKKTPDFRSYLTGMFVGGDGTTWVVQRPVTDSSAARTATVLDERGETIAFVPLSDSLTILAVDRTHMWAAVRTHPALVRFKLQATPPTAAPPPRSASASRGRD